MPGNDDARFTVGRIGVTPGSVNAIPATASCSVDLRHPESAVLNRLEADVTSTLERTAADEGVTVSIRQTVDMAPVTFSDGVVSALEAAAERGGLPTKTMISGAFHDALFLSSHAPSAMIFVPCRDGLSHNEAEFVRPEDSVAGARMFMAATLELLGGRDLA